MRPQHAKAAWPRSPTSDPLPWPLSAALQGKVAVGEASRQDMLSVDREQQFANNVGREFALLLGRAWRQASRNRIVQVGGCVGERSSGLLETDMHRLCLPAQKAHPPPPVEASGPKPPPFVPASRS